MKPPRPPLIIGFVGTLVLISGVLFIMLPLYRSVVSNHNEIETIRLSIATLQEQQKNITNVTKSFSSIQSQSDFASALFLNEEGSVDFFNAVDELYSTTDAIDSHLRIDTPARSPEYQTIGIHFTFSGSYDTARSFIHRLPTLHFPITVQTYTVSRTSNAKSLSVTIDGTLPWRQAL